MTKEEFITKAITLTNKEDFSKLYDEVTNISRAQKMTKNGAAVLKFLQTRPDESFTAKSLGEEMGSNSRSVSGAMRKLVTDGYVEKVGANPTVYKISQKGIEYIFDNE